MYLNEFANLSKDFTGLDEIIWVEEECTYNLEQRKKYRAIT